MSDLLPVLIVALGVASAISLVARGAWPIELLQHVRPQMIVAGALGAVAALLFGPGWEWAAISTGIALINYAALPEPRWIGIDRGAAALPGLTIVWANVWTKQRALQRTFGWARAQKADIILIGEYPVGLSPDDDLTDDYPHRMFGPPQPAGNLMATRIAVYSRAPLIDPAIHAGPGPHDRSFATFRVALAGGELSVIAVHPTPPNSPKLLAERDKQIGMLAKQASEPFVIAGDFNVTPWAPGFAAIPGRRIGPYMFAPTWLSGVPLLGLPIDHMMASPTVQVSACSVGPALRSDHRALLARVHLPAG